jgi:hypothetical protein
MTNNNISIKQPRIIPFSVTPKRLYILGVFLFFAVVAGYIFIKFAAFLFAPKIELENLSSETLIVNTFEISIAGGVRNAHSLTLNGRKLYIGKNGKFESITQLTDGMNILSFAAKNIFGRSSELARRVVYIKN